MKGASKLSMKARRNIVGYVFVLPALLCFVVFVLIPLILSLILSFYTTDMFFMDMTPAGFEISSGYSRICCSGAPSETFCCIR